MSSNRNASEPRATPCPLCTSAGGDVLWRDGVLRVVLADEPEYPGFTRVVWSAHVAEMTDLDPAARERLMRVVWCVERVQREVLRPDKVNLASLGNVVAHLHWHVIPRWRDDLHFPAPVWAAARSHREADAQRRREAVASSLDAYRDTLVAALGRA